MSEMKAGSAVVWFEIPARDFGGTVGFYETLFGAPMRREEIGGTRMAIFSYERPGVGGAVIEAAGQPGGPQPGETGALVYLNCGAHLAEVAGRVEAAGGRLAGPPTELPDGRFVHAFDPEGNRIGLHGF